MCRTGGSRRFFLLAAGRKNFLPFDFVSHSFHCLAASCACQCGKRKWNTRCSFILGQKIVSSFVGNNGIFLACSLACSPIASSLFACFQLKWECPNWLSAATCLPQKAHPPQSPSLSCHITATTYTDNVGPFGKQDFVWPLFIQREYNTETIPIAFSSSTVQIDVLTTIPCYVSTEYVQLWDSVCCSK